MGEYKVEFNLRAHLDTTKSTQDVKFESDDDSETILGMLLWLRENMPDAVEQALGKYMRQLKG